MTMLRRLLRPQASFFDLFDEHAALTVLGANEMLSLATTAANINAKAKRIKELEHETDVITHRCVEALRSTFITPIDRNDIYRLITRMDDVMDFIEAAADRLALYELREMTPELRDLADIVVRCAIGVQEGLGAMRSTTTAAEVVKRCSEIKVLENEADNVLRTALARLFREERDPIVIVKWKEIYEHLEDAADRCEDVANIMESVVIEMA